MNLSNFESYALASVYKNRREYNLSEKSILSLLSSIYIILKEQ